MASSNRHLIGTRSGCYSLVCISDSTTLMEKLTQPNQSFEVSRALLQIQNERTLSGNFFGEIVSVRGGRLLSNVFLGSRRVLNFTTNI